MLQQILKDMYIDPDVLNALNEDQKKTLFLKMRQEQVRRWQEREEKLEREGGDAELKRTKPKKANSKSVSWLLGRDGDVAVLVIGEVDELTSKFICSGLGEKKTSNLQNNANHQTILKNRKTTEAVKTERENLNPISSGIQLNIKAKCGEASTLHPLPVSVSEHSSPPAVEKPELKSANATEEKSVPQSSICSRPPMRASPVNVRPASANAAPGSVNTRPGVANLRLATTAPSPSPSSTVKTDSGKVVPAKAVLNSQEPEKSQESQHGKDIGSSKVYQKATLEDAGSSGNMTPCAGRGRVAQLMKTFSVENSPAQTPSRGIKPPIPTKPSHLRLTTTPSVR
ncbi:SH2 domain-containing protein 4A [Sphaeramia orbicularis]|uniref:SH2 domain-containing protein 4A-like n=1 Tax=Sphaeramia orbicularis TaxID=375764 RepID=A0A672ZV65_9TELE|nr:SH2 domain-containing protein 4A-like [Sphaeramia orbicularis]XP_030009807.1 SH2 domain-containing protein 4A-like [Sphaeramia orbicularis]